MHEPRSSFSNEGIGTQALGYHASQETETTPRLGKDEVEILRREFKKNPKPTTQTKRQIAEDMGVDLARINVRL